MNCRLEKNSFAKLLKSAVSTVLHVRLTKIVEYDSQQLSGTLKTLDPGLYERAPSSGVVRWYEMRNSSSGGNSSIGDAMMFEDPLEFHNLGSQCSEVCMVTMSWLASLLSRRDATWCDLRLQGSNGTARSVPALAHSAAWT